MKTGNFAFIFMMLSLVGFSQLPDFEWASQCGNPPSTTDTKTVLASCEDGSFFMAGEFLDTAQFGTKTIVSAGGTDVFLVKCAEDGEAIWSVRIGGTDYEYIQQIVSDDEGGVLVAGYFYGTTQIGPDIFTSYGSQDLFVAKYDQFGNFIWSIRAGGPMADYLSGLALNPEQDFFIAGYFYNSITIGDTTLQDARSSDIFTAKFSADADLLWVSYAGGSSSDMVNSAVCDHEGNLLIAGAYYNDITMGDTTIMTTNPVGVYVAIYQPDGQLNQVFQLDGTYLTTEVYLAAKPSGGFYMAGNFSEQISFGNDIFEAGEFNQDIFIASYDTYCDLQWARHAHSSSSDQVVGIETDAYNNLFITGHYLDTIQFDLISLPYTLCCGSREVFIVSYSAYGNVLWGDQISGARANIKAFELNQQDELLLSGLFSEEVFMGDLSLSYVDGYRNYLTCLKTEVYTGIGSHTNKTDMVIFPNPARDKIMVGSGSGDPFSFEVYSLNGQLISSGEMINNGEINLTGLPPGHYTLRIIFTLNNKIQTHLFIKI